MAQATLSPELTRQSIALARALSSASRNWGLYPPEHPAVEDVGRNASPTPSAEAWPAPCSPSPSRPKTLLVDGLCRCRERTVGHRRRAAAARSRHPADDVRRRAGHGRRCMRCSTLLPLDRPTSCAPRAARRSVWRRRAQAPWRSSRSTTRRSSRTANVDDALDAPRRHLELDRPLDRRRADDAFDSRSSSACSRSPASAFEIGELLQAVTAPKCSADGSPLITTQAATVLARSAISRAS